MVLLHQERVVVFLIMRLPQHLKAFRKGNPSAVAFIINSPGGSPVQSSLVGDRIKRLSEETEVPTVAFVEDVAASGGLLDASAADEIYADHASIIGSVRPFPRDLDYRNACAIWS